MARNVPEIPTASMADIAFMLLIFFLVATTMDVDTGLSRILPPMPEEKPEDTPPEIRERNIFIVLIDRLDRLMVEGEVMDIKDLKLKTKEFIANPQDLSTLPEKEDLEIDFLGVIPVSKQIISLQNDRGTSYGMYIMVQNELAAAYTELRDEFALQQFGMKFDALDEDRQEAVRKVYPMRISEAEPKSIGGN
jgi:biopolymer transport protein ExbD